MIHTKKLPADLTGSFFMNAYGYSSDDRTGIIPV